MLSQTYGFFTFFYNSKKKMQSIPTSKWSELIVEHTGFPHKNFLNTFQRLATLLQLPLL